MDPAKDTAAEPAMGGEDGGRKRGGEGCGGVSSPNKESERGAGRDEGYMEREIESCEEGDKRGNGECKNERQSCTSV